MRAFHRRKNCRGIEERSTFLTNRRKNKSEIFYHENQDRVNKKQMFSYCPIDNVLEAIFEVMIFRTQYIASASVFIAVQKKPVACWI